MIFILKMTTEMFAEMVEEPIGVKLFVSVAFFKPHVPPG
jgi:hypothetical protein